MKKIKLLAQVGDDCMRYHGLFLASMDAVMTLEPPTWKFTSGNAATLKMFGMKSEKEFVAYPPWKLSPERQFDGRPSSEKAKEMIEIAMKKGSNFFEWTHRRKNGEDFFANVMLSKVKDNGKFFLHAIVRDIDKQKKLELSLIESEEKFRKVFDDAAEGILLAEVGMKKFYMGNKAMCKMLGYTAAEIKTLGVKDIHPKKDLHHVLCQFEKQVKGKLLVAMDLPVKRKDGSIFYADIKSSAVTIAGKSYMMGFFRDNTQRRELDQVLEEVRNAKEKTILEAIGDGVMACDLNGKIIAFNKVASELSGFSYKEAIGKHYCKVLSFMRESTGKPVEDFIGKVMREGKMRDMSNHITIVKKNGMRVSIANSVSPIFDKLGKVTGCVLVFRDVTHEREIDRVKTEFVSFVSHQLRTPLSAVSWYTEMLLAGDVGVMEPNQIDYLEKIYQSNKRMVALINSLLNVSRIELGLFVVDPKKIDIIKVVNDILDEQHRQIMNHQLVVVRKFDKDVFKFLADKNLFRMILQNLIANSIKYTPDKGTIRISISFVGKKNLRIEVSDTGYGIPKNQQSHVFDKFFRADNVREQNTQGTGLGLYIVKMIVEHAGGKIWFKSPVSKLRLGKNKGTAFYVEFPLSGMEKKQGANKLT